MWLDDDMTNTTHQFQVGDTVRIRASNGLTYTRTIITVGIDDDGRAVYLYGTYGTGDWDLINHVDRHGVKA
jgi:hypothetical protein